MERYDVLYTRNNLSKLLARVEAGEEIEISRRGRPVARLVPAEERRYWTGKQLVDWLEANPVPEAQRKTAEQIDEVLREIREGREEE